MPRTRRTKSQIEALKALIVSTVREDQPMTVRQVFYRLVTLGAIGKTEREYKGTVVRLLGELRESGHLPWSWIVDNTRWMRKPRTFDGLTDALADTATFYRRSLWTDATELVEVWLEKEALAGVVYDVTEQWDVPLMVTRGYPSKSYLHSAAETIVEAGRTTVIYYFGDRDPSGLDIPRATEAALGRYVDQLTAHRARETVQARGELFKQLRRGGMDEGEAGILALGQHPVSPPPEVIFHRAAVTTDQVARFDLPTRPTKRTDSRAKNFDGESVELDAIPPATLRDLVERCILAHVDVHELEVLRTAESSERDFLRSLAREAPRLGP